MLISQFVQCLSGLSEWLRVMDGRRSELGEGVDGLACMIAVENTWTSFRFLVCFSCLFSFPYWVWVVDKVILDELHSLRVHLGDYY